MRKLRLNFLRIFTLFLILMGTFVGTFTPTYATVTKVYDQADLLSASDESTLQARIAELAATYQMDIGIVATNSMDGKSSRVYADDFYDQNGFGVGEDYSGVLLLINMEDREVYISTCGEGIRYFTDARINGILDQMSTHLSNQNYAGACTTFLNQVEDKLSLGIPSNQYTQEAQGFKFSLTNTLLYLVVAIVVSLLICLGVSKSYSKPTSISGQAYLNQRSLNYTRREDTFLGAHTSRRRRESSSSSSSSGRSSTHRSSSGRSHGGGGRSF